MTLLPDLLINATVSEGISDCGLRIADWGFKNSMLDAGYSMLDKDLLYTTDT